MLSKEFLDTVSYPITQLYMACENRLLLKIVTRLKTATDTFSIDEWNIKKLSDMGGISRDAYKEIAKTSVQAKKLLGKVLSEVANKSLSMDGVDTTETAGVLQTIKAMQAQAENHLNIVNTTMLVGVQNSYGEIVARLDTERNIILNNATIDLVTGQKTFQTAVGHAVKELSDAGINAYVDKAGREWTPEAYVSMDLRTTSAQTARGVVQAQGKDYNLDVILVSSHAGARPLCEPYQGRCYSMSGRYGTITDAYGRKYDFEPISVTGYDPASGHNSDPAGLFGVNCGHTFRYIEEGAFMNRERTIDTEAERNENEKVYALSQEQRAIERDIRAYKREAELYEKCGLDTLADEARGKVTEARHEYSAFCEQNDRTPRWDRTQIY